MENKITQIVLLGGGYTSIWAYQSLIKKLDYEIAFGDVQIFVVCPEEFHFFHGWTAESLVGIIQDQNRKSSLANIFKKAQLIRATAEEINHETKEVFIRMSDGSRESLNYDHLLIGTGSYDAENIEGITSYGFQVKSEPAYLRTKRQIQSLVEEAATATAAQASEILSIAVAGSGFCGIELVTNIAEFVDHLKNKYPSLQNVRPVIRLVNSKNQLLNELDPGFTRMRKYAEKIVLEYGIEVIHDRRISKVTAEGAWLNDGSLLKSSMVISATGQSRMVLKGTEQMQRDPLQRVYTNRFLQIPNHAGIWGGGDACCVLHCRTERPCAPNALWAIKHGTYAGNNIARSIKGKSLRPFTFRGLGQCASLGIGKGMGELYGFEFTGWIAWITRLLFFNYFMPSRKVMFREIMDWMYLLFSGKRRGLVAEKKEPGVTSASPLEPSYQPILKNNPHRKSGYPY